MVSVLDGSNRNRIAKMSTGDNKGLVLPPRVAKVQVAIVPVGVTAKSTDEDKQKLYKAAESIAENLKQAKVRVEVDLREGYSPGWKFNDWELKGVPLRLELGPRDLASNSVMAARREKEGKDSMPIDKLSSDIPALLETIQQDMFNKAEVEFREHRKQITKWDDFVPSLNAKNVCVIPFCLKEKCEDVIKEQSKGRADSASEEVAEDKRAPSMGAKSLCIPFDQEQYGAIAQGTTCLAPGCSDAAEKWVMFGRSY